MSYRLHCEMAMRGARKKRGSNGDVFNKSAAERSRDTRPASRPPTTSSSQGITRTWEPICPSEA